MATDSKDETPELTEVENRQWYEAGLVIGSTTMPTPTPPATATPTPPTTPTNPKHPINAK